jgi:hypothetical protein
LGTRVGSCYYCILAKLLIKSNYQSSDEIYNSNARRIQFLIY